MTIEIVFDSEDLARLQRTLDKLDARHLMAGAWEMVGSDIQAKASVYPPPTASNRPPYPFYERGYGTRTGPNSGRNTSERMDASWHHAVFPDYAKVWNDASYAGYVQGEGQTAKHKRTGWLKLLDVAKERLPGIIKKLEAQALKIWESTR